MDHTVGLLILSLVTSCFGTLGGIGGATLLVPILVIDGMEPQLAGPLGLLAVGAGSLAASPSQTGSGLVHHRLGVVVEITASAGAIAGAFLAGALPARTLGLLLGVTALVGALASRSGSGLAEPAAGILEGETAGEFPGSLAGQYRDTGGMIHYAAKRVPTGIAAMVTAGLVSGLSGVGGGFIKVPILHRVMGVPVRVAAATSTYTVGITAASALLVSVLDDRVRGATAAPVLLGGLLGGLLGAAVQRSVSTAALRTVTAVLLAVIGFVVIGRELWM